MPKSNAPAKTRARDIKVDDRLYLAGRELRVGRVAITYSSKTQLFLYPAKEILNHHEDLVLVSTDPRTKYLVIPA